MALAAFNPPSMDFLLPLGTWATPPPGRSANPSETPYADWLIPIFDLWYKKYAKQHEIRLFKDIGSLLLGNQVSVEYLGLGIPNNIFVETNGEIQDLDGMKSVREGMPELFVDSPLPPGVMGPPGKLNVFMPRAFEQAFNNYQIRMRQAGRRGLARECQRCPIEEICGGGHYPHRYDVNTKFGYGSFGNRSVYCPDLMKLIGHIAACMLPEVEARVRTVYPNQLPRSVKRDMARLSVASTFASASVRQEVSSSFQ
jgi:uncharacterized protein